MQRQLQVLGVITFRTRLSDSESMMFIAAVTDDFVAAVCHTVHSITGRGATPQTMRDWQS